VQWRQDEFHSVLSSKPHGSLEDPSTGRPSIPAFQQGTADPGYPEFLFTYPDQNHKRKQISGYYRRRMMLLLLGVILDVDQAESMHP
jgi:hypothetical protein